MKDAEEAIELLKSMGAPTGGGEDNSAGIIAIIEKMKVEFNEKVKRHDFNMNAKIDMVNDDLNKRIEEIMETDSKQ